MFGMPTEDPVTALASAVTYWTFRCRSRNASPAMGLKTWTYLQSAIANAAISARHLDDYIVGLCKRLIVPHLSPSKWNDIIAPQQVILRAELGSNGSISELQQLEDLETNVTLRWLSWEDILKKEGISERQIVLLCRSKSYLVATYCRIRYEEDKALNLLETTSEEMD